MKKIILLGILAWTFFACSDKDKPQDGPTFGNAKIAADETLYPLVEAEEKSFEHTYKRANIEVSYLPESKAFQQLLADSVRMVVAARQLTEQEKAHFAKRKITPRVTKIATDAIALLVHVSNPDSMLTCQQALQIFSGEISSWKQLNPRNPGSVINLVFDNEGSSTLGYVLQKSGQDKPPANAYALKTNQAVVDYVASHPNSLGIIGYNWVSDYDDPLTQKLRKQARIVAVSPCEGDSTQNFYKPFADNIQYMLYPFFREVFIINREGWYGVATGFSSFVAGDVGQRIIKNIGIMPMYVVEYKVELKSKPFRVED